VRDIYRQRNITEGDFFIAMLIKKLVGFFDEVLSNGCAFITHIVIR